MNSARITPWLLLLAGPFAAAESAPDPAAPPANPAVRTDLHGDPLPPGAVARMGSSRFQHATPVRCLAFSPSSRILATGSHDGVRLWDAANGRELRQLGDGEDRIFSLSFSPDGRMIAGGGREDLYTWDVATGAAVRPPTRMPYRRVQVAFSPDGRFLATWRGDNAAEQKHAVTLWDPATGREVRELAWVPGRLTAVVFSPDGKRLATSGGDMAVRLWDVATGEQVRQLDYEQGGLSLVFLPGGQALATASRESKLRLWDVATGKPWAGPFAMPKAYWPLAFLPDGTGVATCGEDRLGVWDLATGRPRWTIPTATPVMLAVSPNGKCLATSPGDHGVQLWDAGTGRELHPKRGHRGGVAMLGLSADGRTVTSLGEDERVPRRWDAETGREWSLGLESSDGEEVLCLSPDGRLLAYLGNDATVRVCETTFGRELRRLEGKPKGYTAAAFSANGRFLIVYADDSTIHVWDLVSGKLAHKRTDAVRAEAMELAITSDGRYMAQATTSRLRWFDVQQGKDILISYIQEARLVAQALSPDDRLLAAADKQGTVRVWELATGAEATRFAVRETEFYKLTFSEHGRLLALGDVEGVVHVWDLALSKELCRLKGHRARVFVLAFSADARRLISGSEDGTLLVWDLVGRIPSPLRGSLSPGDLESLWSDLADADAVRARRSLWRLVDTPCQAVSLLRDRLKPAVSPDAQKVARWMADLDHRQLAVREKASRELSDAADLVEPELRRLQQEGESAEVRRRAGHLLESADGPVSLPAHVRHLRAVEVLERLGTAQARQLLEALRHGAPNARLTQEAGAALPRLNHH